MSTPRLYVDFSLTAEEKVQLNNKQTHHLCNVLRIHNGASCLLFDNTGSEYHARVLEVAKNKKYATVAVGCETGKEYESELDITLILAISKPGIFDTSLQKAVELGVKNCIPVYTRHSPVRYTAQSWNKRQYHCQRLIISAAEQCGRNQLCTLHEPQTFSDWLYNKADACPQLLFHPYQPQKLQLPEKSEHIIIVVGPEGGLHSDELELATAEGLVTVNLGRRILRQETAVTAALSFCHTLYGDFPRLR